MSAGLWVRTAAQLLFTITLLFAAAGTFAYWEAWTFIAVFVVSNTALTAYMVGHDPELLKRRIRAGPSAEKSLTQKIIMVLVIASFFGEAIVPAPDHRFGWSDVPASVVILAEVLIVLSYYGFYRVMKENTYGAATIQVEPGQTVVSTGPYALVRHPMYSAALVMSFSIPPALGSWWGLLLFGPVILALVVWRLLDEEKFLRGNLPGYAEYTRKVRYRLVPRVW
jgi:protein-S-isoprenylcysteine O-methyltransferase Ste14